MEIAGLVDPSYSARRFCQQLHPGVGLNVYASRLAELKVNAPEIVTIATPSAIREAQLMEALSVDPGMILIEKPLANDVSTALRMAAATKTYGVPLRVNFHRRFDPMHNELRALIGDDMPQRAVLYYRHSLKNYGTHLIDLLLHWFGEISNVMTLGQDAEDNYSFCCTVADTFPATILAMPNASFDVFECDFWFRDWRLIVRNGGAEYVVLRSEQDPFGFGRSYLKPEPSSRNPAVVGGLVETYQDFAASHESGTSPSGCDAEKAIQGLEVIEEVYRSALEMRLANPHNTHHF